MKIYILIYFSMLWIFSYSQKPMMELFSIDMLQHPENHEDSYLRIFGYNEISRFVSEKKENRIVLENGYASSEIKNKEDWTKIKSGKTVKEISIVFTKYPRKKKDWITDYNKLLASRLMKLFEMDPMLNSKDISWYLLLQTDCKSDIETRTFFHGITITYECKTFTENDKKIIPENHDRNQHNFMKPDIAESDSIDENSRKYKFYANEKDYDINNSFLYRETSKIPNKKKQGKMPKCPDFSKKRIKRVF